MNFSKYAAKPPSERQSNSRLGMLCMLGGMFLFAAVDAQAKYLTQTLHPAQIIWFRQLGLALGIIFLIFYKGPGILKTQRLPLQVLRGSLVVCSTLLFVYAVKYAALADAVAVSFVAPFFLTLLGALVLGETVSLKRWLAVLVGFIGAVIIIRPGGDAVHPSVMLVAVAALFYAMRQTIGRLLADTDKTITTIAYTALISTAIISIPLPFVWVTPDTTKVFSIILCMAILAAVAEVLVIKALEVAEAAVVAPIHYSLIIWSSMYSFFIFNQFPDIWTWIGTAIIVIAGMAAIKK